MASPRILLDGGYWVGRWPRREIERERWYPQVEWLMEMTEGETEGGHKKGSTVNLRRLSWDQRVHHGKISGAILGPAVCNVYICC